MKELLLTLHHLAVIIAKLCGPGGVRAVIAENLLLKQQLIVPRRARQRAPNLTLSDRLLYGYESIFLGPERIQKSPSPYGVLRQNPRGAVLESQSRLS